MKFILLIFSTFNALSFGFAQNTNSVTPDSCKIVVPHIVTIDCSTGNDYQFNVTCNCKTTNFKMFIYDKWANLQFSTNDITEPWIASQSPSGTYFWVVIGRDNNGEEFEKQGQMQLIR